MYGGKLVFTQLMYQPGCEGTAAKLEYWPDSQKLTPPSSAFVLSQGNSVKARATNALAIPAAGPRSCSMCAEFSLQQHRFSHRSSELVWPGRRAASLLSA